MVFEKVAVISDVEKLIDAVAYTFALYFILNVEYPEKLSCLLEMIQRYFFKIHPDQGSKSKKLNQTKRKVITLMNKLNDA